MTNEEAAWILREMYHAGGTRGGGRKTTAMHMFGIKYANDISRLHVGEILHQAGISHSYLTEVYKGVRLAEYVQVVNEFP